MCNNAFWKTINGIGQKRKLNFKSFLEAITNDNSVKFAKILLKNDDDFN